MFAIKWYMILFIIVRSRYPLLLFQSSSIFQKKNAAFFNLSYIFKNTAWVLWSITYGPQCTSFRILFAKLFNLVDQARKHGKGTDLIIFLPYARMLPYVLYKIWISKNQFTWSTRLKRKSREFDMLSLLLIF